MAKLDLNNEDISGHANMMWEKVRGLYYRKRTPGNLVLRRVGETHSKIGYRIPSGAFQYHVNIGSNILMD